MQIQEEKRVVIIGGGPAGLTAAYQLRKASVPAVVLERDETVGGLSRTVNHKGYRFDIGGHRFYTKVKRVDDLWREVLPAGDFLRRPRLSRIYYAGKFFPYPLRALATLSRLGLRESFLILLSYLRARLFPEKSEESLEQWVSNRFGRRLFRTFFKTYTEKVWGMSCREIAADWAAQRIQNLSLYTAVRNSLLRPLRRGKAGLIKTLIEEFDYPRLGPGMMWEAMAQAVERAGGEVRLGACVERILWDGDGVRAVEVSAGGRRETVRGTDFISSMPIRELIQKLEPAAPAAVAAAAESLRYRDFITVAVVVNRRDLFPDNWIYVHDPEVSLGRVQNFKNWSPEMVPDGAKTCVGLEYFCTEGDALWALTDDELVELGKAELTRIGLVEEGEAEEGFVVRVKKAYPVYDSGYKESLLTVQSFLAGLRNLHLVGRNGMHRYNNQDHSMLTAMLAVENILGASHNLWAVNDRQDYLEEVGGGEEGGELSDLASTQPLVARTIQDKVIRGAVRPRVPPPAR